MRDVELTRAVCRKMVFAAPEGARIGSALRGVAAEHPRAEAVQAFAPVGERGL